MLIGYLLLSFTIFLIFCQMFINMIQGRLVRVILSYLTISNQNEYLLGIREATGFSDPSKKPNVSIGNVVVLKDKQTKRAFWMMAIIKELIVSRDDNIRAAKVRVSTNRRAFMTRSLKHLVPLEIFLMQMLLLLNRQSRSNL